MSTQENITSRPSFEKSERIISAFSGGGTSADTHEAKILTAGEKTF